MKLLRFMHANRAHVGVLSDRGVVPVQEINARRGTRVRDNLLAIIEGKTLEPLRDLRDLAAIPVDEIQPLLPYDRPPKIWCIGLNYRSHAEDINAVQPEEPGSFMKPASSMFPPGGEIVLPPPDISNDVDAEGELGVIIGQKCRFVPAENVRDVIFGYTTTLDMTALDVLRRNTRYLTRAKSIDTFFSFGPVIVTADEIDDVNALEVITEHNGGICSRDFVRNMRTGPFELVRFHSDYMTLYPGDLISTGCPKGARIKPGDRVRARIEGVGVLEQASFKAGVEMPQRLTERILEAVDSCATDMLEFTRELVAIPTENPPGNEYERCAEAIFKRLVSLGLEPRMAGPCVLASVGAGERVLRFHGHYDVVPRSVEDQFEPRIEGANLFGRGSSDMKSGLAAMIYAAHALRAVDLDGRVELVMVPDEETGGERGTVRLAAAGHFDSGGVGMLTAEPTSGVVWNASRGAISLRVTVHGKPAHVGLSCQGVNAFERMLVIARALEELKSEIEQRETAFAITPNAARRSILMMGGECRGGSNFNLVPDSCTFTVDRRLNPEEDLQTEMDRLTELFERLQRQGVEHKIEIFQVGRASGVPREAPLAVSLAHAVETVTGKPPKFEMCPGLLECRFYAEHGIPALAYGPGFLSVSHGPNEFVPIRNIRDCAASYALTAAELLKK